MLKSTLWMGYTPHLTISKNQQTFQALLIMRSRWSAYTSVIEYMGLLCNTANILQLTLQYMPLLP